MADFPVLNSFGTLIRFALALEESLGSLASQAATLPASAAKAPLLAEMVKKHAKQQKKLERMAREQLNEVVLQPIEGMLREDYLPPQELGTDALSTLAGAQGLAVRFYTDTADMAADVLAGLARQFRKLASRSEAWQQELLA